MGVKKRIGKKIVQGGKVIAGKTPEEAAEEVGIKFLETYKKGQKLPKQVLKYLNVKNKPGWVKKILSVAGIGGGSVAADRYLFTGENSIKNREEKMNKAKGGYVKMNRGGEAKRKSSSSKKSRGTGAAIKGTKFKGVF